MGFIPSSSCFNYQMCKAEVLTTLSTDVVCVDFDELSDVLHDADSFPGRPSPGWVIIGRLWVVLEDNVQYIMYIMYNVQACDIKYKQQTRTVYAAHTQGNFLTRTWCPEIYFGPIDWVDLVADISKYRKCNCLRLIALRVWGM